MIPANVRPPFRSRMAWSKVAHEQSSRFIASTLGRRKIILKLLPRKQSNHLRTDFAHELLRLWSYCSHLTGLVFSKTSFSQAFLEAFSVVQNHHRWKVLSSERNQYVILFEFLLTSWVQLGDQLSTTAGPFSQVSNCHSGQVWLMVRPYGCPASLK